MKKIIRLTESELVNVIKRVIKEDTQKTQINLGVMECYSSEKYPKIALALKNAGLTTAAITSIVVGLFTTPTGFGSAFLMGAGSGELARQFMMNFVAETKTKMYEGLEKELNDLFKCMSEKFSNKSWLEKIAGGF